MDFSKFVSKATEQDKRNKFAKYDGNLDMVPDELKPFYRVYNPVDVEIDTGIGSVRFCPADSLGELQSEYAYLGVQFVFATCNGDPIFLNDGQVYTCPHGVNTPKWEPLDVKLLFL
jgi:hypothetical protein